MIVFLMPLEHTAHWIDPPGMKTTFKEGQTPF